MSRAARRRQSHGLHIFLTVILVILTACVVVKAFFLKAPEQKAAELPASQPAEEENSPSDEEQAAQEALRSHLERKGGFYTILVSGVDDGNGGSDTNILVAVDTVNGYVYGVSIPGIPRPSLAARPTKSTTPTIRAESPCWRTRSPSSWGFPWITPSAWT
ncbi:MAG: hypothetical protein V8R27_07505 [Oscillospiraceae bacterium]